MRHISSIFPSVGFAFACALAVGPWTGSAFAQDDLYGVPAPKSGTESAPAASAPVETVASP